MLLPVAEAGDKKVQLVGLCAAFKPPAITDYITVGSPVCERVIWQKYFANGKEVSLDELDHHSWAVLDTMGTQVLVDGQLVGHDRVAIAGAAGMVATSIARPKVLAVAQPADFGRILTRLGARYTLLMVETLDEARAILRDDRIDVLMLAEDTGGASSHQFVTEVSEISEFTACVHMVDRTQSACDERKVVDGKFTQQLVRPVGEFTLRRVLDEASDFVIHRQQSLLNEED